MPEDRREFKGVWFPAEVWLDERLTALEKIILIEIDSLDGEEGGYASNEYLAQFCQCSQSKVSSAISKLKRLGYIKVKSFDGRKRILESCLSVSITQTPKIKKADTQNQDERILKETTSKEGKKERKKPEAFDAIIEQFTDDEDLRQALGEFVRYRTASAQKSKKAFTSYALKQNIGKLRNLASNPKTMTAIVNQTIERGWSGFFPLKDEGATTVVYGRSGQTGGRQQEIDLSDFEESRKKWVEDIPEEVKR